MSRLFDDASSEYLEVSAAPSFTDQLFFDAWIYPDAFPADHTVVSIGRGDLSDRYVQLIVRSNGAIRFRIRSALEVQAGTSSTTLTVNTWNHAAGYALWSGGTNDAGPRHAWLNGGGKGTSTALMNSTGFGPDTTTIGATLRSSRTEYFSGRIANVTIRNGLPSDVDVLSLAAGAHPFTVRPDLIVGYWPVWGRNSPELDLRASNNMTVNGTVVAEHPPKVYGPAMPFAPLPASAAPPVVGYPSGYHDPQILQNNPGAM
jgi:hypothetical protein